MSDSELQLVTHRAEETRLVTLPLGTASLALGQDAEEYTQALGQIMSGGWRQIALAHRLGVPAALGMTTRDWVRERIGGYVRLGLAERPEVARELTMPIEEGGEFGFTHREAADVLGVDHSTVTRDLHAGADAPAEASSPGGEGDDPGAHAPAEEAAERYGVDEHGCRAFYGQPLCDDCGEPHRDDESCPELTNARAILERDDEDGSMARHRLRVQFATAYRAAHELVMLRPDAVADVLDAEQGNAMLEAIPNPDGEQLAAVQVSLRVPPGRAARGLR